MFTLLDKGPHVCGETPVWVEEENSVYWVDAAAHAVFSYSFSTGSTSRYQPSVPVTAIRIAASGIFYLLSKYGLYLWSPAGSSREGTIRGGVDVLDSSGSVRFNDGIPVPGGGFVAGAFDESDLFNGNGSLHFIDANGQASLIDENLHVPNGVALTGDGQTLYLAEMYKYRIISYSRSEVDQSFTRGGVHLEMDEEEGKPDGLLCDRDDNLWVAHWRGWKMSCYSPEAKRKVEVNTPFATPTCPCWKGRDQKEMIVTSATLELTEQELTSSTSPGGLFLLELHENNGR